MRKMGDEEEEDEEEEEADDGEPLGGLSELCWCHRGGPLGRLANIVEHSGGLKTFEPLPQHRNLFTTWAPGSRIGAGPPLLVPAAPLWRSKHKRGPPTPKRAGGRVMPGRGAGRLVFTPSGSSALCAQRATAGAKHWRSKHKPRRRAQGEMRRSRPSQKAAGLLTSPGGF